MPKIAIQTPFYRSSAYLPMLLKSLKAQTVTDWVYYCCENSGDDEERKKVSKILAESGIPYVFSESATNLGFAGGHNTLMAKHEAEFILLLNEDAYLAPDHLEKCLKRFELDPQAGAVVGIVYRWTAPVDQEEVVGPDTFIDTIELDYRCLANVVDRAAGKQRKEVESELSQARRVMGVSGAVCLIKRSAAEAVSPEKLLFDPTFFMYREDVDLAIRLHRKGFRAWFDPSILSFHRRSIKAPKGMYARILDERRRPAHLREVMFRNQWKLYAYHGSLQLGVYDVGRSIAHEAVHLVFIFLSSPSVFSRGVFSIIRAWPEAWRRRKVLADLGLEHHSLT